MDNLKINKTVSVIIPTFNRSDFLCEAVESVLSQSYKQLEIIIVNDGSTDNTEKVVKNYPVRYLEQSNQGVIAARNRGVKAATGDYTFFLDDDDLLFDHSIEELVNFKNNQTEEVRAVYGYPAFINSKKTFRPEKIYTSRNRLIFDFLIGNKFSGLGLLDTEMLRKSGGFNPDFPYAEDYELWTRIILDYQIAVLQKQTFIYRKHSGQSSSGNLDLVRLDVDKVSFNLLYSVNIEEEARLFLKAKISESEDIAKLLENLSVRILYKQLPAFDTALEILKIAQKHFYTEKRNNLIIRLENNIPVYLKKGFNTSERISEDEKNKLRGQLWKNLKMK